MKKLDIKRALSEHNMTQADLYQKIGMSPQAICMIIKNNNPTVAKLMQIAEGIGCDITDLFYPTPAEEVAEQERREKEMKQDIKEGLAHAKDDDIPLSQKLQDLVKKAYPGIKREEVDELMQRYGLKWREGIASRLKSLSKEMEEEISHYGLSEKDWKRLVQKADEEAERLYWNLDCCLENGENRNNLGLYSTINNDKRTDNDNNRTDNGMMRTEAFCPHCGKKMRVGVVLLSEE